MKTNTPQTIGFSRNMIYLFLASLALVALVILSSCSSTHTDVSYMSDEGIDIIPSVEDATGHNSSSIADSSETSLKIKEKTRRNLIHWMSY